MRWTACAWVMLCTTLVRADPPPPQPAGYDTPRLMALGTGLRAGATSTSALGVNPAGLAYGNLYHLEGVADYQLSRDVLALQAGIVDTVTSKLGAGFGVRGFLSTGEHGFTGSDFRLGFGFPLGDMIAVGVTGRYVSLQYEGLTPRGGNPYRMDLVKGGTIDAAVRLNALEGLQIAALGYNLINLRSPYAPVMLGGSVTYGMGDTLQLGGDVLFDLTSFDRTSLVAGGGLEYVVAGMVPLRGGYRYDSGYRLHSLTAGVGYLEQQIGIDLSVRQDFGSWRGTAVMASLRYFVQ